jgi:two-component sensor histidine kinase
MDKKLIIFLFLIYSQSVYLQSFDKKNDVNSILNSIKNTKNHYNKINLHHKLCSLYYPENPKKMEYFNNIIGKLSKTHNYNKGAGYYHLNLSYLNYIKGNLKNAITKGEKAYKILSKTNDLKNKLDAATFLAFTYYENYEDHKARNLLNENINSAHRLNDNKILGRIYLFLASTYTESDPKEELKYNKKSLHYYNLANDNDGKIALYHRMAMIYKKIGAYEESLKNIDLCLNLNSKDYKYIMQIEKAIIYNKLKKYSKARTISLDNEVYFLKNNQSSSALFSTNKLALATSNFELKKYENAILDASMLLKFDNSIEIKKSALNILSKSYLKLGDYKRAKSFFNQSMSIEGNTNSDYDKEDEFKIKSNLEEVSKNYKSALLYYKKYSDLSIEKVQKINNDKLQLLQIDFNLAEKESRIKKLEIVNLEKSILMQKQKNQLLSTYFIILIGLVSIIIKILTTIKRKNKTIEETNKQLEKAIQLSKKSLLEKELLLKEIHHRVKNNLQLIMSLLNIQAREGETKDINEFLKIGQSRIISIALIHENLYQTEKLDKVDFQEYLQNLILNINDAFGNKDININTEIKSSNIKFDIQTAIPLSLIINELYCNILKHAFPNTNNGRVKIEIVIKNENQFQLIMSDDGIGIIDNKTKKTLGLELVYLLVNQLNGKLVTENNNGLKYIIDFQELLN